MITLPQGTIPSFQFQSNQDYQPHDNGTTILNASQNAFAHTININGLSKMRILKNPNGRLLVCDGNGIKGDNISDISIDAVVKNCKRNQDDHQGFNGSGLNNVRLKIDYDNCNYAAIFNNLCTNLLIDGGTATNCGIHLKSVFQNGSTAKVQNFLVHDSGGYYAVEFQPTNKAQTDRIVVDCINNAVVRPKMSTAQKQSNSGGWSIPMEAGLVRIRGNFFDGTTPDGRVPSPPNYYGPLMVIEMGSNGGDCSNNWIQFANDPVAVNLVSKVCTIKKNLILHCLEPANMTSGGVINENVFENNDDKTVLAEPGGWGLVGAIPPNSVPIPPQPVENWKDLYTLQQEQTSKIIRVKP